MKHLLCRAIFLRHGQSNYTEVFPDITEEGKRVIKESAKAIKEKWRQWGCPSLRLLSSPKARALGSATIIKEVLEYSDEIQACSAISCLECRCIEKAKEIFEGYKSAGHSLEADYPHNPLFEDGRIFEPRSTIQKRFFVFLEDFFRQSKDIKTFSLFIFVSHYEVLYNFIESIFRNYIDKGGVLSYGELIIVSLYDNFIEVEFRKQKAEIFSLRSFLPCCL